MNNYREAYKDPACKLFVDRALLGASCLILGGVLGYCDAINTNYQTSQYLDCKLWVDKLTGPMMEGKDCPK